MLDQIIICLEILGIDNRKQICFSFIKLQSKKKKKKKKVGEEVDICWWLW